MLRRLLVCTFAALLYCQTAYSAESPIAIAQGSNFYGQEEWEPGKVRQWMSNNAELRIQNNGAPIRVHLRFVAESFRVPRRLQVRVGGQVHLELTIPPEPLYVVAKDVPLAAGETVVVLSADPGPDKVSQYHASSDQRELSIAFGPFSAIDAQTPQAQREETAAFPQADRVMPQLSAIENEAGNLRREGRLLEAKDAYQRALTSDTIYPTTYLWAGLTQIVLDDLNNARTTLTKGRSAGGVNAAALTVRQACAKLLDYMDRSELLADQARDPARAFRQRGEIYRAVAVYRRILQQDPENLVASYWLGLLSALAERPNEAKPLLGTVARGRPDSPDAAMARELQRYVGGR
jgi:tetratricopeptide (TPR) repeat protein